MIFNRDLFGPRGVIDVPEDDVLERAEDYRKIEFQNDLATRRERDLLKSSRISGCKINKYVHAIDTIIDWASQNNQATNSSQLVESINIDYFYFNFEDRMDSAKELFERFLDKLVAVHGLKSWSTQMRVNSRRYHFQSIDIRNLKSYREAISFENPNQFPYENSLLVIHDDGRVEFFAKSGMKYMIPMKPMNNPFLLLKFLARNKNSLFSSKECAINLKKMRSMADSSDERRVRDTIEAIREFFNFKEGDDFIRVDNVHFGIFCNVHLE